MSNDDKYDFVISRISMLEGSIKDLIDNPPQKTVDKVVKIMNTRLKERDSNHEKILALKLENLSKSLLLEVKSTFNETISKLEDKISISIKNATKSRNEKMSWAMDVVKFLILVATFILSIKFMK